ncbi:MmcB family DNA repair protein [Brucella abortus]|nr:MmcB family DNA repair protein [Brucella abortus]
MEIKSSIEDWKADHNGRNTAPIAIGCSLPRTPAVPREIFPEECGFILSDGYGAEILREAPEHRLAGATRKALMLRFARAGPPALMAAELAGLDVPGTEID